MVDRERPGESPLLIIPTRPHGNVKSAIFTTRETNQYKQLVAWAYQVANQPLPDGIGTASELASPNSRRAAKRQSSHKTPRAVANPSPESQPGTTAAVRRPPGPSSGRAGDDPTAETSASDDVDPFDPAVFNRRYHPAGDEE